MWKSSGYTIALKRLGLHQFCNEYVQLIVSVREVSLLENSYYGSYEKGNALVHCKDEMVHIAEVILEAERKQIHSSVRERAKNKIWS